MRPNDNKFVDNASQRLTFPFENNIYTVYSYDYVQRMNENFIFFINSHHTLLISRGNTLCSSQKTDFSKIEEDINSGKSFYPFILTVEENC